MIAMVRGLLLEKGVDSVVVEAGGIGYELFLPAPALQALPAPGAEVRFFTHFHVREDAQILFGFLTPADRQVFLLLMTVKGVGPKVALAILSHLSGPDLAAALMKRDLAALTRLPGVGKKLAERLGVELSDKVKTLGLDLGASLVSGTQFGGLDGPWLQAQSALTALGYSQNQAKNAVETTYKQWGDRPVSVEDIVKAALKAV
ncbi:MAG TPA: Holliday junction branch migration protein RuvA [bacterium]|nr:Holliday junction branch migration protein RuvA [bacterium]